MPVAPRAGTPVAPRAGTPVAPPDLRLLLDQIASRVACPISSGLGRLFDSVAALLGVQRVNTFEGQAPLRLEDVAGSAATAAELPPFALEVGDDVRVGECPEGLAAFEEGLRSLTPERLDPRPVLRGLAAQRLTGTPVAALAAGFHQRLAEALAASAASAARTLRLTRVGLTGGCFLNEILEREVTAVLRRAGLEVLVHTKVPPNDGGIALGQAACAHARREVERGRPAPASRQGAKTQRHLGGLGVLARGAAGVSPAPKEDR
jgi:hydrogenase maturation protein HypF